MKRVFAALIGAAAFSSAAFAQTATLSLTSPQNGLTVSPGAPINWTIAFTVSTGNNQGLALLAVDLTQADANPAFIDIPIASGVPAGMTNFARPAGITNPGDGNALLGYRGVQRGTTGHKQLRQIGGAQNTFGQTRPPGSGIAEVANVVSGIGQSGSTTLATGSFNAPSAAGLYTFQIENGVANVVIQRNNAPQISTVDDATVTLAAPSITFTVGGTPCPGDVDGDLEVDIADLSLLLSQFGSVGPGFSADLDHDNDVDLADLSLLLSNFGTTC